ncbi:hypothetical protein JCM11641_005375 [Rhodosporidiobolus odoratus]
MDLSTFAPSGQASLDVCLADLERDVNEREERLTSFLQVLGFPSLDDLEDFIVLHGGVKVVPSAESRSDKDPLDETQTQFSETAHAKRHQERRAENAALRTENERVRAEVEWIRRERDKDKERAEQLAKDKSRLLDRVEELRQENEALKAAGSEAENGDGGSSLSTVIDAAVQAELEGCHNYIADLEASIAQFEEEVERLKAELKNAREKNDEDELQRQTAEETLRELLAEKDRLQKEIRPLKKKYDTLRATFRMIEEEQPPSQPREQQPSSSAGLTRIRTSPGPSGSHPAIPTPAPQLRGPPAPFQPSPRTNRSAVAPPSHAASPASVFAKPISTPGAPRPSVPDRVPSATSSVGGEAEVSRNATPTSTASMAKPPPLPSTLPSTTSAPTAAFPSAPLAHVAAPRPTAVPSYLQQHLATPSSPLSDPASSSTSVTSEANPPTPDPLARPPSTIPPGLDSESTTRYKLWPQLLRNYTYHRSVLLERLELHSIAHEVITTFPPQLQSLIRDKAWPPPTLPAEQDFAEGGRFEPNPSLPPPDEHEQWLALARSGQFADIYRRVVAGEAGLRAFSETITKWNARVGGLCERAQKKEAKQKAAGEAAAATPEATKGDGTRPVPAKRPLVEGETVPPSSASTRSGGTPAGQPVKKRRRVVKGAAGGKEGTPAPVAASSTLASPLPRSTPTNAVLLSATGLTSPRRPSTPRPSQPAQPSTAIPSTLGNSTLVAAAAAVAVETGSSKGKKRWNLASPTKRNAASPLLQSPHSPGGRKIKLNLNATSPHKVPSGKKQQAAMLVDDTPLVSAATSPALPDVSRAVAPAAVPRPQQPILAPDPPAPAAPRRRSSSLTPLRSDSTSTYEPEPDTLVTEVGVGDSGRRQSVASSSTARARERSSTKSPSKGPPRRTASVTPHAEVPNSPATAKQVNNGGGGGSGKGKGRALDIVDEDDPFIDRPRPSTERAKQGAKAVFALQPSPNSRTSPKSLTTTSSGKRVKEPHNVALQCDHAPASPSPSPSHSPSPSPAKPLSRAASQIFELPPSAQPMRRLSSLAEAAPSPPPPCILALTEGKNRQAGGEGERQEEDSDDALLREELRFFGGLGTPPDESLVAKRKAVWEQQEVSGMEKKSKGGRKRARPETNEEEVSREVLAKVKDEELSQLAFLPSVAGNAQSVRREEEVESISPPRSGARRRGARGARAGKGGEAGKKLCQSTLSQEERSEADDLDMPQYPDNEEGRRGWIALLKKKRRERAAKEVEEKKRRKSEGSASTSRAIEINPERNKGQTHFVKEVVRDKKERAKMLAEACGDCSAYYDRTNREVHAGICDHARKAPGGGAAKFYLDMRHEQENERLQANGRHRTAQPSDREPPDYWQFGMPSTQGVEDINARAKAQSEEKEAWRLAEAEQGGLYRYRDEN